ncbi:MAG: molecular chaperone DnaK [Candidatus Eremiobacteraeota bacterium]|nr:molecular chaperone DnaK [Candidatus Eremiobacteraeota bacterium]
MSKIVGIDLGTTNSVCSIMEGGQPIAIPSAEGDALVPSVVGFSKTGERLVGAVAKRQAISNPERTIISIKRHMGTEFKVQIDDKSYTPQEISAMILQKIKADAEAYLGFPIERSIITVPAYFNDSERQATKDAGTIAGMEVVRIINEPTASAMAYGLDKLDHSEKILVWDLGGGTFDVSILEIGGGIFEVKATAGNMRLGGDDWDQRVMDWLVDEFKKMHGIDLRTDRVAMQRLKEAGENAKIQLSSDTTTRINLPFIAADAQGPKHLDIELTRQKFQEMSADLVEKCVEPAMRAMEDSGLTMGQINKVLLVGGSTRMPAVQDKVRKLFGKEPCKEIDPDRVVAMGAAIQGGVLSGEVKDMVLLDVTSLSLGIETVGGVFTKLIERNTQIPCSKSRIFTTAADGQTIVEVHVLQGERELAAHNKSLGRFELRNIPPAPRGVPQIEVVFEIDANGIVNVSAKDLATGNKQKITIQSPTNLTGEEINKMVKEAAIYAEEDGKRRDESQTRNKANIELDTAERTIRELSDKMSIDYQRQLREAIDRLRMSLQTYDIPKIKEDTKALQDVMYMVSTEAYLSIEGAKIPSAFAGGGGAAAAKKAKETITMDEPTEEDLFGWFQK